MDFFKLAAERYSVRKFSSKGVEQENLKQVLEAGRIAPTAVNYQPQRILVMENEEAMGKLRQCTPYHFDAPMALLVCYDTGASWKSGEGVDMGIVDASIVTTHMMLAAAQLGLGTTWVGHFSREKARALFEIPDYLIPAAILPLGYPAEDCKPHPTLHFSRLPLEETVYRNSFDGIRPGKDHSGEH